LIETSIMGLSDTAKLSATMNDVDITPATVRFAAMNLLAMREHSLKELRTKLARKFGPHEAIEGELERLRDEGLQSDTRFAEAFFNMRKNQGKGQLLIAMELRERGISGELINDLVALDQDEWNQLALIAKQKKFGPQIAQDIKTKTKQMRFLSARGFNSVSIQYALKHIQ
jgi:regulatory protein